MKFNLQSIIFYLNFYLITTNQLNYHIIVYQMQKLDQSNLLEQINNDHSLNTLNNKPFPIKFKPKCINNNDIHQFCINRFCQFSQQNLFLCNDQDCKCNQKHELCQKVKIKAVLKKINEKKKKNQNKLSQLKVEIGKIFNDLVNKISQFEEDTYKKIQTVFDCIGLVEIEKKFQQIFINEKVQYLKSFDRESLSIFIQKINPSIKNDIVKQQSVICIQKILKIGSDCLQKIQQVKTKIHQSIDNIIKKKRKIQLNLPLVINKNKLVLKEPQKYFKQTEINLIQYNLLSISSIIKSNQQLTKLINFFPKKIKNLNLIFKASEHGFSMDQYYKKCSLQANTIILCETTKNKIIGGYTPLVFYPLQNNNQWVRDYFSSSFFFSLTNNDKFQLKDNSKAIYRYKQKNFIDIGYILTINNWASNNNSSTTCLSSNFYFNKNYTDCQQSYLKLNGNTTKKFTAKQWEVYKVQFA